MTSPVQFIFPGSNGQPLFMTIDGDDSSTASLRDGIAQGYTSLQISRLEYFSCLRQALYLPIVPSPFPSTHYQQAPPHIPLQTPVVFPSRGPKTGIETPWVTPLGTQGLFTASSLDSAHSYLSNPSRGSSIMSRPSTTLQPGLHTAASPTQSQNPPKRPKLVISDLLPKYRTEKHLKFSIELVEEDGAGACSSSHGQHYQSDTSLLSKKFIQVPRTANVRPTEHGESHTLGQLVCLLISIT